MDVGGWLRGLGLGQYEALFRASEIDADILPELTDADLEKLSVPLGHRKRLLRAISGLAAAEISAAPSAPTGAKPHDGRLCHSFETHAYARETGIIYGDNRADERAARRLLPDRCPLLRDTRATGIIYGDNRADERAARRLRPPSASRGAYVRAHARDRHPMYGNNQAAGR